jgi:hypothetical protein
MGQIILLQGGVGDFLQCLPFIDANKDKDYRYGAVTHFSGALEFFKAVGLQPEFVHIFHDQDGQVKMLNGLSRSETYVHCPRAQYFPEFPFDLKKMRFSNGKPTLGIHINGSPYSIATQKKFGMVPKNIPVKVIKELISDAYNIMIFGSHEEVKGMGIEEDDNLKHICYPDIAESLAYVQQCNAVVASDSAIKTMSAMNHIPTFVWLGDYPDGPRDQMFIDPYVNDGVMKVFRYKDVHTQFDEGITQTKAFIKEVL